MAGGDDPYTVLGVARSASQIEIKAAYQTLVGRYHPDLHQQNPLADLATERLAQINEAYALLSDPARRAAYDAGFRAWTRGRGRRERGEQARAQGGRTTRVVFTALLVLLALPLVIRVAVALYRLGRIAAARLFGAGGALAGGRVAALVVLLASIVAVVAWRRKARRRQSPSPRARPD